MTTETDKSSDAVIKAVEDTLRSNARTVLGAFTPLEKRIMTEELAADAVADAAANRTPAQQERDKMRMLSNLSQAEFQQYQLDPDGFMQRRKG